MKMNAKTTSKLPQRQPYYKKNEKKKTYKPRIYNPALAYIYIPERKGYVEYLDSDIECNGKWSDFGVVDEIEYARKYVYVYAMKLANRFKYKYPNIKVIKEDEVEE